MGRKNKYITNIEPFLDKIKEWYGELTEEQIAKRLGVAVSSFENYKKQYPELVEALNQGQEILVEELKKTLKMKAKGFHYKETKKVMREVDGKQTKTIEEYEKYSLPDTGAIHLLLKNYDDTWRNDDRETMDLKREKLELEKQKAEDERW